MSFPFRVAFVACCILLTLGYLLLQMRLHSGGPIQIRALPLQVQATPEFSEPDESALFSSPPPGSDPSK